MSKAHERPGRSEAVLGAAFCAVAAARLPFMLTGSDCPMAWQWTAAVAGGAAMMVAIWRRSRQRRKLTAA